MVAVFVIKMSRAQKGGLQESSDCVEHLAFGDDDGGSKPEESGGQGPDHYIYGHPQVF